MIVDGSNARWKSGTEFEEKKNSVDVSSPQDCPQHFLYGAATYTHTPSTRPDIYKDADPYSS